jgi:hypothetical protein
MYFENTLKPPKNIQKICLLGNVSFASLAVVPHRPGLIELRPGSTFLSVCPYFREKRSDLNSYKILASYVYESYPPRYPPAYPHLLPSHPDMLSKSFLVYALFATLHSTAFASSALPARDNQGNGGLRSLDDAAKQFPELLPLVKGNDEFREDIAASNDPNLLQELTTNGQHPQYLFVGCR